MNKKYILGTFIILTSILLTLSFNGSYAKKNDNTNILDLNDQNFNQNVKEYIDKIDDRYIMKISCGDNIIICQYMVARIQNITPLVWDAKTECYEAIWKYNSEAIIDDMISFGTQIEWRRWHG